MAADTAAPPSVRIQSYTAAAWWPGTTEQFQARMWENELLGDTVGPGGKEQHSPGWRPASLD